MLKLCAFKSKAAAAAALMTTLMHIQWQALGRWGLGVCLIPTNAYWW